MSGDTVNKNGRVPQLGEGAEAAPLSEWLSGELEPVLQNLRCELARCQQEEAGLEVIQRQVEEEWRAVFDAVPVVGVVLDEVAAVVKLNRHGQAEAGMDQGRAAGRSIHHIGSGEPWQTFWLLHQKGEASASAVALDGSSSRVWSVSVHRLVGVEPARWIARAAQLA